MLGPVPANLLCQLFEFRLAQQKAWSAYSRETELDHSVLFVLITVYFRSTVKQDFLRGILQLDQKQHC